MSTVATHKDDPEVTRAISAAVVEPYATFCEALKLGRWTGAPLRSSVRDSAEVLLPSPPWRWNRRGRTFPGCGHAVNLLINYRATPTQR